jgi:hypothetical protein
MIDDAFMIDLSSVNGLMGRNGSKAIQPKAAV